MISGDIKHAFRKFSSKVNVSNSFKASPASDSNVYFMWSKTYTEVPTLPKKAMVNNYILLECIELKKNFSTEVRKNRPLKKAAIVNHTALTVIAHN